MHSFEQRIKNTIGGVLQADDLKVLQVNVGMKCNLVCTHCHLACSPKREEMMSWPTMAGIIQLARQVRPERVDITGGAPELNPLLKRLILALREEGLTVQCRTNLSVLMEEEMSSFPEFFRDQQVQLVGSMPCYLEENVNSQRGRGTYDRSVAALQRLNRLGYGSDPALQLDLVYNPGKAFLPPDQASLEQDYKRELLQRFGIRFHRLLTITNIPLGRFDHTLRRNGEREAYMDLLRGAFNERTLAGLMCRHQLSINWDGSLYDCDFNLALGLKIHAPTPATLDHFDVEALVRRKIITDEHCFACTAGAGSSCGGALD